MIVYLYNEGIKNLNFRQIQEFIWKNFGRIPIRLISLKKQVTETRGLLFDFIGTQKAFAKLTCAKEKDICQIILTQKLFATLDEPRPCTQGRGEQKRLHLRAAIFGFPSLISTSGIVEGPAKPREFYLYKQKYTQLGVWEKEEARIKEKFKGRFIDYQDRRLTEVLKGYIAQAMFFYLSGQPFCRVKSCRLYNAHWQEDLIYSQIKSGRFCLKHKKILQEIEGST